MAKFYLVEQLGPKQGLTPEGFLLCRDAPLARVGSQLYRADEVYDKVPDGLRPDQPVRVYREPAEVFRPETIASFEGKAVVDEHPEKDGERVDVTPENWKEFSVGVIINPRRGEGTQDDLLLGDLLITHAQTIKEVREGKRELSCGYDAKYVETGPGKMEQQQIVGNHVALVESGRCGPRCAIGDRRTVHDAREELDMPKIVDEKAVGRRGWFRDLLARGRKVTDADGLEELAEGAEKELAEEGTEDGAPHVHIHHHGGAADDGEEKPGEHGESHAAGKEDPIPGLTQRITDLETKFSEYGKSQDSYRKMHDDWSKHRRDDDSEWRTRDDETVSEHNKKIEGELELEAPTGSGLAKARDSVSMRDSFVSTVAVAEIIVPGIRVPTFDAKATPRKTFDALTALRKSTVEFAHAQPGTRQLVVDALGGRAYDPAALTRMEVRSLFFAVGAMKRAANNNGGEQRRVADGASGVGMGGGGLVATTKRSVADLQKANEEFWRKQNAGTR